VARRRNRGWGRRWVHPSHLRTNGSENLCSQKRQSGHVFAVAWSIDGLLASGSEDKRVMIWNPSTGKRLKTLKGHGGWVSAVAWSFDGKVLASGGADKRIILWNAKNGVRLTELKGHSAEINGVRFSLDGTMLASCSGSSYQNVNSVVCTAVEVTESSTNKTHSLFRLWDVGTGRERKKFQGHSKDNKNCTCEFDDEYLETSNPACPVQRHSRSVVRTVAWSFDGKVLASGCDDARIILWDAKMDERMTELKGHSCDVNAVAWSIDGLLSPVAAPTIQ
jgi:WD40 repeat protein